VQLLTTRREAGAVYSQKNDFKNTLWVKVIKHRYFLALKTGQNTPADAEYL
jgi:hypothetical protein